VVSEIPFHPLSHVLLIHDSIAIIHLVGFVAHNLFSHLTWHTCPVKIPSCCPSSIVKELLGKSCTLTGRIPCLFKSFHALPVAMKHKRASFNLLLPPPFYNLG